MLRFAAVQVASFTSDRSIYEQVLETERIRNARRINRVRVVVTTIFLVQWLIAPLITAPEFKSIAMRIDAAYWVIAITLWLLARRSERIAHVCILSIGLLDIPLILLKNRFIISAFATHTGIPTQEEFAGLYGTIWLAMAVLLPCLYAVLLSFTLLALRRTQVAVAGVLSMTCVATLLAHIGIPGRLIVAACMLLLLATGLATYTTDRSISLVAEVAKAQSRRAKLRRYLSPSVAEMIEASGAEGFPGELREVTVLFSDIRGFTSMAERLEPIAVVGLLNAYHTAMSDIVFQHGGTLDKFIGDGLMAYFGAPVSQPDHASRAVACALAMQERLAEMNVVRQSQGLPALRIGIGLHSGPVVLGDIGSPQQHDCTIVGDTVNVASRMEQLTKQRDVPILISRQTRELVGDAFQFDDAGESALPGRIGHISTCVPLASLKK
ncbi:MAG TPA: adenylate/guanylate cyclase domain-containing protein [Phycisphaerales bacterium]|nr:adenylate/guanylate cyclase domain-containing protein [Phycisphaerales bacterium]